MFKVFTLAWECRDVAPQARRPRLTRHTEAAATDERGIAARGGLAGSACPRTGERALGYRVRRRPDGQPGRSSQRRRFQVASRSGSTLLPRPSRHRRRVENRVGQAHRRPFDQAVLLDIEIVCPPGDSARTGLAFGRNAQSERGVGCRGARPVNDRGDPARLITARERTARSAHRRIRAGCPRRAAHRPVEAAG